MVLGSTLVSLSLLVPAAEAGRIGKKSISVPAGVSVSVDKGLTVPVVIDTEDTEIGSVVAEVSSAAGSHTLALVESNLRLHGTASLLAPPSADATITITLYDASSAVVGGSVQTCTRMKRDDVCGDGNPVRGYDLEVVSTGLFTTAAGGVELGVDVGGADTSDVAYASVVVSEPKSVTTCDKSGCTTKTTTTETKAEVGWTQLAALWTGELTTAPSGAATVKVTVNDNAGKKLHQSTMTAVTDWLDGADGTSAVPTDDDPLTSLSLAEVPALADVISTDDGTDPVAAMILSDGWSASSTLPATATLTLDAGDTLSIPAQSYQVTTVQAVSFSGDAAKEAFQLTIDGVVMKTGTGLGARGVCAYGRCFSLAADEKGAWWLSATAYAATSAALPKSVKVSLTPTLGAAKPTASSYSLTYDTTVAVLFAAAVTFDGDPIGADLCVAVELTSAADKKGKSKVVSKGGVCGTSGWGSGGALGLAAMADGDVELDRGDILIGGEPIGFEMTAVDTGGVISVVPPAVVLMTSSNGKGTRDVGTTTSTKPGLL